MSKNKLTAETDIIYDSINKLASALTGSESLDKKLGQVVEELRIITKADGTSIWLKEGTTLWCIAGKGHYEDMQKGKKEEATYDMEKEDGLTVHIAKSGETINIKSNDELRAHPHWQGKYDSKNYLHRGKCNSFIGTPLKIGDEIIGVIKADNRKGQKGKPGRFSKAEEKLFKILAALTAIIIKNDQMQKRDKDRQRNELETRQMMAAVVVHNLNNPAAGVRNALKNIELGLQRKPLREDTIRKSIRNGLIQVRQILSTRDAFLSLIRPERSEGLADVDLYAFVQDLLEEIKVEVPNIVFECSGLDKSLHMRAPVVALKIAFNSLIQNAIEATRGLSERVIRINLILPKSRTKRGKSHTSAMKARLDIIDSGPGVHPDIKPNLFEAFRSTKELGTGLGLFASRQIMKSVDGDITYKPKMEIGTRFVISFPYTEGVDS
jgi:signal transduction histidine kinase